MQHQFYPRRFFMYVLAINGSPRKGGNTDNMLQHVLKPLESAGWETELYQLGGKNIRGCMACMKCWENKDMKCVVDNDKFNGLFEKMVRADAIVIGSPTYLRRSARKSRRCWTAPAWWLLLTAVSSRARSVRQWWPSVEAVQSTYSTPSITCS